MLEKSLIETDPEVAAIMVRTTTQPALFDMTQH